MAEFKNNNNAERKDKLVRMIDNDLFKYGVESEVDFDLKPTILVTVPESQRRRAQDIIAQLYAGEVVRYNATHKDGMVTLYYAC